MQIILFTQFTQLKNSEYFAEFQEFIENTPTGNFFQSPEFLQFIEPVRGYKPFLWLSLSAAGRIQGSLLGVIQSDGGGVKSWLSRRLIVWGGPVVHETGKTEIARALLEAMKKTARGSAIFIEFRNFFDCSELNGSFEASGFRFRPHLNYVVRLDDEKSVTGRLSSNRRRQIRSSLNAGAVVTEPESEADVLAFYQLLVRLYREKVKKPLPNLDLFMQFWKSPSSKTFLVKYNGQVVGGSVGPVYRNEAIYQWYVCGDNGVIQGVHPSVLASWAPMEYGLKHGYKFFDFMGAGRPDEEYGVREFKARFGGDELSYGRYELVLSQPLYKVGKLGLKVYQSLR